MLGRYFTIRTDHRALLSALKSNRGNKTSFSRLARWVDRILPFTFDFEHIAGKNMGWADYMSRHPSGKAHAISPYDQSFSIAKIGKLKPMLQQCKIKRKQTTNEHRDVNRADRHALNKANETSEQTTHAISSVFGCNSLVSKHTLTLNLMPHECENNNEDTASTISSIPTDYEGDTLASVNEYLTAQQSVAGSEEKPQVDHQLVNAIVAAIETKRTEKCDQQTATDNTQVISHFSPELVKTLSQSDGLIQKLIKALKGTEAERVAMGSYWRSLWRDLHVTTGCLFLDNRIVLPSSLQPAFWNFLHSTHGGARAMWGRTDYVWFPHIYKSIQTQARSCVECTQTGKNLACFTNVKVSAERSKVEAGFDEIEMDYMGPIGTNTESQRYALIVIDRYSRFPFAMCCNGPTAEHAKRFLVELKKLFGLPKALRTDQGTAFTSDTIRQWCEKHSVKQICSPVGDHRGTGLVERLIKTLRWRMGTCMLKDKHLTFKDTLDRVLSELRECNHATTGKTPYELLFGRKPNTTFSNLKNVLDNRRLLAKGHWRSGRESSNDHLTARDSESDTDDEVPLISLKANRRPRAVEQPQEPEGDTGSVAEVISSGDEAGSIQEIEFAPNEAANMEPNAELPESCTEMQQKKGAEAAAKSTSQAITGVHEATPTSKNRYR